MFGKAKLRNLGEREMNVFYFFSHALCMYLFFNSQLSSSSSLLYVVLFVCVLSQAVVAHLLFLTILAIVLSYAIDRTISKMSLGYLESLHVIIMFDKFVW